MPKIPLPQFPPQFMAPCYKCGSLNVHFSFSRHPWLWTQSEIQYSCKICGVSGYGADAVLSRWLPLLDAWSEAQLKPKPAAAPPPRTSPTAGTRAKKRDREPDVVHEEISHSARSESVDAKPATEPAPVLEPEAAPEPEAVSDHGVSVGRALLERAAAVRVRAEAAIARQKIARSDRKRENDRERNARRKADRAMRRARQDALQSAQKCALATCDKRAEPRSKYCSRTCSNRNAAQRAKERKQCQEVAETLSDLPQ